MTVSRVERYFDILTYIYQYNSKQEVTPAISLVSIRHRSFYVKMTIHESQSCICFSCPFTCVPKHTAFQLCLPHSNTIGLLLSLNSHLHSVTTWKCPHGNADDFVFFLASRNKVVSPHVSNQ